ncbi:MAG: hypothetical protein NWE98_01760 [Candidatus Bathyarchaeota archaeon]|nr:hypothetical protein [Candidatus Bathyarchaeota archaeon]
MYSCLKCGTDFEIYPPDDIHVVASRIEDETSHFVKVEHVCKNCGYVNVIYWGHRPSDPAWDT